MQILNLPLTFSLCFLLLGSGLIAGKGEKMTQHQNSKVQFTENKGQWDSDVIFRASVQGMNVWYTDNHIRFEAYKKERTPNFYSYKRNKKQSEQEVRMTGHVWDLKLNGGHLNKKNFKGIEANISKNNYLYGKNPDKWSTECSNYKAISLGEVYDGIELKYYGTPTGDLEYDFIVSPGADFNQIDLHYEGLNGIRINDKGQLELETTHLGTIVETAPYVYQMIDGKRQEVAMKYIKTSNGFSFDLKEGADYRKDLDLIIDPVTLLYSTYIQNPLSDGYTYDNEATADGELIFIGSEFVSNTDYPVTAGAYDVTFSGGWCDVVLTKLNADGTALLWSTFIGGSGSDLGWGFTMDADENIYIVGQTTSADFPTTVTAYDTSLNGTSYDNFVLKLNSTGSNILWSTYVGGVYGEGESFGDLHINIPILLDNDNNVYVLSDTRSADFPTTSGAYDETQSAANNRDLVVFKLNSTGTSLLWSTYLGGTGGYSSGGDMVFDGSNNLIITGGTEAEFFPTTTGAYDETHNGDVDGLICKLSNDGSTLMWSSFIGGDGWEYLGGIDVFSDGNLAIVGTSQPLDPSTWDNFPTTAGTYQATPINQYGNGSAVLFKFSDDGTSLIWSTWFSGTVGYNWGVDCAVLCNDDVVISGPCTSNIPLTADAYDKVYSSGEIHLSKFSGDGTTLKYCTYMGGNDSDYYNAVLSKDDKGHIYYTNTSHSTDFPTTPRAYQPTCGANIEDKHVAMKWIPDAVVDFGDLPAEYPVASAGVLMSACDNTYAPASGEAAWLGTRVDGELASAPNTGALGDDNALIDDEDGFTITGQSPPYVLTGGQTYTFNVTVNGSGTAKPVYYAMWFDVNRDGDFTDPDDIFVTRVKNHGSPVVDSYTVTLPPVLSGVTAGVRFAATPVSTTFTKADNGEVTLTNGEIEDYVIRLNIGLPVELLYLNIKEKDCSNVLSWETASEINTDYFIVERSTDKENFEQVQSVIATGEASRYEFTDEKPQGAEIFYRLKMMDTDGSFEYSEIVSVKMSCNDTEVSIFPNPVGSVLFFQSHQVLPEPALAQFYSLEGRLMKSVMLTSWQDAVDLSELAKGLYILKIEGYGEFKFVKQ